MEQQQQQQHERWEGQDQPVVSTCDEDFRRLFGMEGLVSSVADDMNFDFANFPDRTIDSMVPPPHSRDHPSQLVEMSVDTNMNHNHADPRFAGRGQQQQQQQQPPPPMAALKNGSSGGPRNDDAISNIDAQIHYLQQQKYRQQQRQMHEQGTAMYQNYGHHPVPPTPQSFELPPRSQTYPQVDTASSQQGSYDLTYQQHMLDHSDMAFTPLVSPAVTPLESHFHMENMFANSGNYFSPLTSPALHAQPDSAFTAQHDSYLNVDMDLPEAATVNSSVNEPNKMNRKTGSMSRRGRSRSRSGIKSSPISRPQRRKPRPSSAIVTQILSEIEDDDATPIAEPNMLPLPASSTDDSEENVSVSPENLNNQNMPPPPVPARSVPGPTNLATQKPVAPLLPSHPATPASLMRLTASRQDMSSSPTQTNGMVVDRKDMAIDQIESLELPKSLAVLDNSGASAPQAGTAAASAPVSVMLKSPSGSANPSTGPSVESKTPLPVSASPSPSLRPTSSSGSFKKSSATAPPRATHKRRAGSVQASPALLPRISPNLKPLLPGGSGLSVAEDAASRLLTSKSNYQNLLEGNLLPGVSYPSELSTHLTSKRTSHKLAEQGRRNRINTALQELASLLPDHQDPLAISDERDKDGDKDERDKEKGKGGRGEEEEKKDNNNKQLNAPNSKASVVESAIIHMKHLQAEKAEMQRELDELRQRVGSFKGDS